MSRVLTAALQRLTFIRYVDSVEMLWFEHIRLSIRGDVFEVRSPSFDFVVEQLVNGCLQVTPAALSIQAQLNDPTQPARYRISDHVQALTIDIVQEYCESCGGPDMDETVDQRVWLIKWLSAFHERDPGGLIDTMKSIEGRRIFF